MARTWTEREIEIGDDLRIAVAEAGEGRPMLVLHGGGGPATTQPIAEHLAAGGRVLAPTHPGFMGRPRPERLQDIPALAAAYRRMLTQEDLRDVLVVGNSIGGWIAMEMAAEDAEDRIGGLVLIDSTGIDLPQEPMPDFFSLTPQDVARFSFHDPRNSPLDGVDLDETARATMAQNMATLRLLAGDPYMHDPALPSRLGRISAPTLVVWGEADRIVPPAYGRALAERIPDARLEILARAGHLPQFERPAELAALIDAFAAAGVH